MNDSSIGGEFPDQTNPKDLVGLKKAPLRLVPPALVIETAPAMANGAGKYGPYNWREKAVRLTVYLEAIQRHLYALMDGEDIAPDSGVKHLAHIAACAGIIFDAESIGKLIDDRPTKGAAAELLERQVQKREPLPHKVLGIPLIEDETLPPGWVELQDQSGAMLAYFETGPLPAHVQTWVRELDGVRVQAFPEETHLEWHVRSVKEVTEDASQTAGR